MSERSTPATTSPESIIQIEDRYYVLASSSLVDHRTQILKDGPTCVILDRYGDLHPLGRGQGLYHDGTRHLCRFELRVAGQRPILLSSTVKNDNTAAVADLTNPVLRMDGTRALAQDMVHILRTTVVWDGTWHQRISLRAFVPEAIPLGLDLVFAADFADMFEVRGIRRERRGRTLPPEIGADVVTLAYEGLDGRVRRTVLSFTPAPVRLAHDEAHFEVTVEAGAEVVLDVAVTCVSEAAPASAGDFERARVSAAAALAERTPDAGVVDSSNEWFNDWVNRSAADLRMMLSETPDGGLYPYAGVPWFDAPFGRDGLVTALETLWLAPSIAAGVLRYLAATQATAVDPASDAEPGKILHEARGGEMALCGEVPFHRYYGTVDATPLFVALAHAYHHRTGDRGLIDDIWPSLQRAVAWLDHHGDRNGDGFVDYLRLTPEGLANQGWKDSQDSISHADGALADGPIALCEVQGYVYRAYLGAAALASLREDPEMEQACRARAERLRRLFEERFWLPDLDTYALALDGEKRPCRVRASNAGHALLAGIASPERAARVARTLMSERSFTGWGVRTLAVGEARYNPISYHNGSVWPHDNALVAAGMARYRLKEPVLQLFTGLFDACSFMDLKRMPELFCGFNRRAAEGPTLYPVACAPQSWAAGAVYLLLQACLGLTVDGRNQRVLFAAPVLPPFLQELRIRDLRVGDGAIDLLISRHPGDVAVQVTRREGNVGVTIVK